MPVITLTSDWGFHDHYVAALKGRILGIDNSLSVVDLNHSVQPFNIAQAAFIIKNSYSFFPERTVHLICVNTEAHNGKNCIALQAEGQFFIMGDNGLPGLIFDNEQPLQAVAIEKFGPCLSTFPELELFVPAACHLARAGKFEELGKRIDQPDRQVPLRPTIDESVITGSVIYIDSYQNAITNISRSLIERIGKKRKFEIFIKSNHYKLNHINFSYSETAVGELLVLFNSSGLLEVAINNGNAADLLGLSIGSAIRIKFND
jgi:S-adenosyl-L-methionine hydrolase (adenosine-forming)